MERITRIAFNSAGWRQPTGEAAEHEQSGTYNELNKFGHEDWLFRNEWVLDGWRYTFLQGVGKSRRALLRINEPFDVTLFTVEPSKRRRYVARIREAEALSDEQANEAVAAFRAAGWIGTMEEEIRQIGGNASALGDARWAAHLLNVRFRRENVDHLPPDIYAGSEDPIAFRHRYQLYKLGNKLTAPEWSSPAGSALPPIVQSAFRRAVGPTTISPEHARMQATLMRELTEENPGARVVREIDYIDVLVETRDALCLYEIKSDLAPRTVIRLAIGQLLEYAYRLANPKQKRIELVIVGREELSASESGYLEHLRIQHRLPLQYRVVPL